MRGVIIAAGQASRMTAKFLLPVVHEGQWVPLFEYQLRWLAYHGCTSITAVITPDSPLPQMFGNIDWVVQSYPKGVFDAIRRGCKGELCIVLACDNVVPFYEALPLTNKNTVTLRPVKNTANLDALVDGKFVRGGDGPALTYPFFMDGNLDDFESAAVVHQSAFGWYDIGTPETYYEYVCNNKTNS